MSTEFKVGMRVRFSYDRRYPGTITEVVDEDEVMVKWDGSEGSDSADTSELVAYDPEGDKAKALIVQPKIDKAASALEHAYKLWQEAQELFDETFDGDAMIDDGLVDMSKLEEAFEATGWSTSGSRSLYC